jgi:predicted AAA+ superfamily ATPase
MIRDFETYLHKWKNANNRIPLLVRGARQVGKTYTIKKFAKENFKYVAYITFDDDKYLDDVLSKTLNPDDILDAILKQTHIQRSQKRLAGRRLSGVYSVVTKLCACL